LLLRAARLLFLGREVAKLYRLLLDGMLREATGRRVEEATREPLRAADLSAFHEHADEFGYCTEVLVEASRADLGQLRVALAEIGTSVLAVGDDELVRLHVHTERPGRVLDLAVDLGQILSVKVDNMGAQHRAFFSAASVPDPTAGVPAQTSLVAVAWGEGFAQLFASLGATVVSPAAPNPSVEELVAGIERAPSPEVVVLPNDPNVWMAAQEAARLAMGKRTFVVATASCPQGVAAGLALCPEEGGQANLPALQRAAGRCHCIQLARAVRAVDFGGVAVDLGAIVGFVDRQPAASGLSYAETLEGALARLPPQDYELATIYVGADGSEEQAQELAELLRRERALPVEIVWGGQPHYAYLISAE
jgi:dihydroxyacetone kinase-like predicted kinase